MLGNIFEPNTLYACVKRQVRKLALTGTVGFEPTTLRLIEK